MHSTLKCRSTVATTRSRRSLYFCFVHTPLHYLRLLDEGRRLAVLTALGITGLMAVVGAVPKWSAFSARLLPRRLRLLAPFDEGGELVSRAYT